MTIPTRLAALEKEAQHKADADVDAAIDRVVAGKSAADLDALTREVEAEVKRELEEQNR